MKIPTFLFTVLIQCSLTAALFAQGTAPRVREKAAVPAEKNKFHLYLLIGQSNMAGRGVVEPVDTIGHPRVLRLNKEGEWEIAKDPVHFDKPVAGVGPGLTFGKTMADRDTSIVVGLIPCAVGGSGIDVWVAGAYYQPTKTYPYDDALRRAEVAAKAGTLKGILWDQGESDSNPQKSAVYGGKLLQLITRLRQQLGVADLPFVAALLPAYQASYTDASGKKIGNPSVETVNKAIRSLRCPAYTFISSKGVTDIGDHTHLTAASQRIMGQRFARAMVRLQQAEKKKH